MGGLIKKMPASVHLGPHRHHRALRRAAALRVREQVARLHRAPREGVVLHRRADDVRVGRRVPLPVPADPQRSSSGSSSPSTARSARRRCRSSSRRPCSSSPSWGSRCSRRRFSEIVSAMIYPLFGTAGVRSLRTARSRQPGLLQRVRRHVDGDGALRGLVRLHPLRRSEDEEGAPARHRLLGRAASSSGGDALLVRLLPAVPAGVRPAPRPCLPSARGGAAAGAARAAGRRRTQVLHRRCTGLSRSTRSRSSSSFPL